MTDKKKEFLDKFAIHCSDIKGEWYSWLDIDTPLTVWQWIETKIDEACKSMGIISVSTFENIDIDEQIEEAEIRGYNNALRDLQKRFSPSPLDEVKNEN